jgi:hypothetical protein
MKLPTALINRDLRHAVGYQAELRHSQPAFAPRVAARFTLPFIRAASRRVFWRRRTQVDQFLHSHQINLILSYSISFLSIRPYYNFTYSRQPFSARQRLYMSKAVKMLRDIKGKSGCRINSKMVYTLINT